MDDRHLVLYGLAIKKHASAAAVAALVGLSEDRVSELLAEATAGGRSVEAQGAYLLSPAGRMIVDGQCAKFYAEMRLDRGFIQANERFERINTELKQLITDWQLMEVGGQKVRNDHADAEYDAHMLSRLGDLHDRFTPIIQALSCAVPRLRHYLGKLEQALERAEAGDGRWVSDAKLESYHTVWFEMHEDLLRIRDGVREE